MPAEDKGTWFTGVAVLVAGAVVVEDTTALLIENIPRDGGLNSSHGVVGVNSDDAFNLIGSDSIQIRLPDGRTGSVIVSQSRQHERQGTVIVPSSLLSRLQKGCLGVGPCLESGHRRPSELRSALRCDLLKIPRPTWYRWRSSDPGTETKRSIPLAMIGPYGVEELAAPGRDHSIESRVGHGHQPRT